MKHYSVHFIDRKNYVFACEEFFSFSDADAIVEIRERPLPRFCGAFEIWRQESLVFRGSIRRQHADCGDESFGQLPPADMRVASEGVS